MNICIDCGRDYIYDPNNPKGSSAYRCSNCRKKETELQKKIKLFSIASNGPPSCRCCNYSKSERALSLIDAVNFLEKASNQEEKEKQAKRQFVVCLNCKARIDGGELEFKINDSSSCPVNVSFFETKVIVTKERKEIKVENKSQDALEVEIVEGETGELHRANARAKRISTIEV